MIKKKICMLGAFAVGKTSLVQRYVENIFSEKYQTTIGVKISKKSVTIENQNMELVLWDLAGKDGISEIKTTYLRGASGYLLVIDKTRINTINVAWELHSIAREILGNIPFLILINKWDLEGAWDMDNEKKPSLRKNINKWDLSGIDNIDKNKITDLIKDKGEAIITSAKTGMGVNKAFERLAIKIMETEK